MKRGVLGKLKSHIQISEAGTHPHTMQKNKLRMLKDLNIRQDIIKRLAENIGKTFSDINRTDVFLGWFPKATEIKAKINKWDLIKLTSFCTAKETVKKMRRQPTEWEKIVANNAIDKGFNLQNIKIPHTTQ